RARRGGPSPARAPQRGPGIVPTLLVVLPRMKLVSRSTGALGAATEPFARRGRAGSRRLVTEIFARGGITVGGTEPWDLRVHDDRFHDRVLAEGTLGLGESYMDGWWDCDALDELVHRALRFELDRYTGSLRDVALALRAK